MKSAHLATNKFADKWTILYIVVPAVVLYVNITSWNQIVHKWNHLGLRMQSWWDKVIDRFGDDSFYFYACVMNIWNIALFWTVGLLYLVLELLSWPKWLMRFKVQPNVTVDRKRLLSLIGRVLFNHLFVSAPFTILGYYVLNIFSTPPPVRELPTFMKFVTDIAIFLPLQEVVGYYTHKIAHYRWYYKRMHKIHHEWSTPIALSAQYNHPFDHFFGNILPSTICFPFTGSHFFTIWLWLTWSTVKALSDHSGYQFINFPSPQQHDYHHQHKSHECFGVWGPLDYLLGTDTKFKIYYEAIVNKKSESKTNTE